MHNNRIEETSKIVQRCNKRIAIIHEKKNKLKAKRKASSESWKLFLEILLHTPELIFHSIKWTVIAIIRIKRFFAELL